MSASKSKKKQTSALCAWIREHRKASWLIGACAALLILILILNALDLFYFLDGRLRYFNGKVYGTQENDIVSRVGAARDNRFCISGVFDPSTEYPMDEQFFSYIDNNLHCWAYKDDSDSSIFLMTVQGGHLSAKDLHAAQISAYTEVDENGQSVLSGKEFTGTTAKGIPYYGLARPVQLEPYDEAGNYYRRQCFVYLDTVDDACACVGVFAKSGDPAVLASDEELIGRALEFADRISLPK